MAFVELDFNLGAAWRELAPATCVMIVFVADSLANKNNEQRASLCSIVCLQHKSHTHSMVNRDRKMRAARTSQSK